MQTTRAIASRVLVAPSQGEETGVPNIAGKEKRRLRIFTIHARGTRACRLPVVLHVKNAMYVGRAYNNARPT